MWVVRHLYCVWSLCKTPQNPTRMPHAKSGHIPWKLAVHNEYKNRQTHRHRLDQLTTAAEQDPKDIYMNCPGVTLKCIKSHLYHVVFISTCTVFYYPFYVRFYDCTAYTVYFYSIRCLNLLLLRVTLNISRSVNLPRRPGRQWHAVMTMFYERRTRDPRTADWDWPTLASAGPPQLDWQLHVTSPPHKRQPSTFQPPVQH